MPGALAGVRVLDLSRLLPGPYCSLLLADLGADVIKVEEPGRGDYARATPADVADSGIGAYFLFLEPEQAEPHPQPEAPRRAAVFRRLAATADVVLESFRPGVMDRLGLGWEALSALNPRLVYCALSGYGQDGPYRGSGGPRRQLHGVRRCPGGDRAPGRPAYHVRGPGGRSRGRSPGGRLQHRRRAAPALDHRAAGS